MKHEFPALKLLDCDNEIALEAHGGTMNSTNAPLVEAPSLKLCIPLTYYDQSDEVRRYLDQEQAQDLAQYILDWLRSLNGNTSIPRDGD